MPASAQRAHGLAHAGPQRVDQPDQRREFEPGRFRPAAGTGRAGRAASPEASAITRSPRAAISSAAACTAARRGRGHAAHVEHALRRALDGDPGRAVPRVVARGVTVVGLERDLVDRAGRGAAASSRSTPRLAASASNAMSVGSPRQVQASSRWCRSASLQASAISSARRSAGPSSVGMARAARCCRSARSPRRSPRSTVRRRDAHLAHRELVAGQRARSCRSRSACSCRVPRPPAGGARSRRAFAMRRAAMASVDRHRHRQSLRDRGHRERHAEHEHRRRWPGRSPARRLAPITHGGRRARPRRSRG